MLRKYKPNVSNPTTITNLLGLVSEILENQQSLQKEAFKLAQKISKKDPLAVTVTKQVIRVVSTQPESVSAKFQDLAFNSLFNNRGTQSYIDRFINRRKRKPVLRPKL